MNFSDITTIITVGILTYYVWFITIAIFLSKEKYAYTK